MTGFKNFILRGNLVDIAVAFIIGLAFAAVVTTFTNWLTGLMPDSASNVFSNEPNSFGAFLNAVISFLIISAVIFFFVVKPLNLLLSRRNAQAETPEPEAPAEDVRLLGEIRDLLRDQGSSSLPSRPT